MEEYETIKKGKKVLKIYVDEDPQTPREWDNLGKFVLSHKKYNFPNELNINFDDFDGWGEIQKHLKEELKAVLIWEVNCYEHGGLSISLNRNYPFNDYFDGGRLGFICVTEDDIKAEYGKLNKTNIKKAEKVLKGEFETYKNFIEGDVYGFKVFKIIKVKVTKEYKDKTETENTTEEEEGDSCWGFFGDDGIKQIKQETGFS